MRFIYNKYKNTEIDSFIALYKEAFKGTYRIETFQWQFNKTPLGFLASIAKDADNDFTLAGLSIGIILNACIENKAILSCRMQNSMVSENYRGLGLFKQTLEDLTKQFFSKGGSFMLAFPTRQISRHTFYSLNYINFNIQTYRFSILKNSTQVENPNFILNEIIDFGIEDEKLITANLNQYKIYQTRDRNYLNWRFRDNPDKKYYIIRLFDSNKLQSLLVYKIYQNELDVVDIFYYKKENNYFNEIINALQNAALKHNCIAINIWSASHYSYHEMIIQYGFCKTDMTTNISLRFNPEEKNECLNDFKSYYFTFSDSDVY